MATTDTQTVEDTRSESERNGIKADAQSKEGEAQSKQDYIDGLKADLKRLDTAYEEVKAIKDSMEDDWWFTIRKHYDYLNNGNTKWVGKNYDNFEDFVDEDLKTSFKAAIKSVDNVLDEIGLKRTEYENKIIDETTILSGLWKTINSLWDKWKNYWN